MILGDSHLCTACGDAFPYIDITGKAIPDWISGYCTVCEQWSRFVRHETTFGVLAAPDRKGGGWL